MHVEIDTGRSLERISAELVDSPACATLVLFAHGAGAGMHHEFMRKTSDALLESGIATLRFQFPYMEKGRKPPDRQPVLTSTIAGMVPRAREAAAGRPLYIGGKSMGGRMASIAAAEDRLTGAAGLIFFGFPLHPAKKISLDRAGHLGDISLPMLFLQGTRDRLADNDAIGSVCANLSTTATLRQFAGADHSFHFLKSAGREPDSIYSELAAAVRHFTNQPGVAAA